MAPNFTHFIFSLIFFSLFLHKASAQSASNEKQILLKIKNDWRNPPSLSSWNITDDHCEFAGIHCSGDGFVDGIELYNFGISFPIPASICDLKNLTFLKLSINNIPGEFPTVLYNCSKLQELEISDNYFVGELPADIDKMPSNLTHLEISGNNFTGYIPPAIGRMPAIKYLDLANNLFNGTTPAEMGNLSTLQTLKLAGNPFSPAKICPEFGNLTRLTYLWMSKMNLVGEIPNSFGKLVNLEHLDLAMNSLVGEIPASVWMIKPLKILYLYENKLAGEISSIFSGELPFSYWKMSYIQELSLSRNQISGEIPAAIGFLDLSVLDLSNNQLSGQIPHTMGSMILHSLDLSKNNLSGEIPSTLGALELSFLNLSENDLSGEIPVPFQNQFFERSFLSNPNLCASNSNFNIQICKNKSKKVSTGLLILFFFLGAIISSGAALCFLITKEHRRRQKPGSFPSEWKLTSFQVVNFNESAILNSLTNDNLVGSGGGGEVYRVSLNRDTVAVKKIHSTSSIDSNVEKQFLAEVNILGSIRHDNIVKLLCCISGENSKLLVYDYIQNGSLDRNLHRRQRGSAAPLDWPTRRQIAVGAAKGLCYMHHHCNPPIIHRDVKSSNILLDSKFNAKIADFGLAKILERGGEPLSVSAVAWSFGYMAPECRNLIKVNEKVDVYSFGVVLLELVTGKEAGDGGEEEDENLTDWAWRRYRESGIVVDEEIAGASPEWVKEAEMMFKVGILCTVHNPAERPKMEEVVHLLMKLGGGGGGGGGGGTPLLESRSRMGSRRKQIVDVKEDSDDSVISQLAGLLSL